MMKYLLFTGTEVFMPESGQDIYIDTIGMVCCYLIMYYLFYIIDDTYVATDVQAVGKCKTWSLYECHLKWIAFSISEENISMYSDINWSHFIRMTIIYL